MKRPFKKLYGLLLTWISFLYLIPTSAFAESHTDSTVYNLIDRAGNRVIKATTGRETESAKAAEDGLSAFWTGATWVGEGLLSITGFFLWIGGITYDWVLQNWVFNMGALLKGVDALYIGWSAFRDVGNIIIIFGLLAIGIATILRISGYGMKDLLVKLVIVAMLINFSFIFTTTIIDTSNFLAFQFYTKADTSGVVQGETISVRFANALKLQTIYNGLRDSGGAVTEQNQESTAGTFTRGLSGQQLFLAQFFGSVLLLITAFSFLAASFLLIIRFGVLILLIVISPVAFVLMAIPKGAGLAGQWWSKLLSHAFYAPVYMLFVYITLIIIEDAAFLGQTSSGQLDFSELFKGTSGAIVIMANYLIITVFMLASIILGSKMGLAGSNMVMRMAKWTRGQTSRPFRATGRGARRYAARTASGLSRRVENIGADKEKSGRAAKGFAKIINKVPLARTGLQKGGQYFARDAAKRAEEMGQYRTGELKRRMDTKTTSRTKAAVTDALTKKGDLDDMTIPQLQGEVKRRKRMGMGTRKLEIMRPDALYDKNDIEGSKKKMEAAMSKIGVGDISELDKVIFSKFDGNGEEKENYKEINKMLVGAMTRVFDGRKLIEGIRQGNEISSQIVGELDRKVPHTGERSAAAIANYYETSSKDERNPADGSPGNEKIANSKLSVARVLRSVPAQRLLEPEDRRSGQGGSGGGSQQGGSGGGSQQGGSGGGSQQGGSGGGSQQGGSGGRSSTSANLRQQRQKRGTGYGH